MMPARVDDAVGDARRHRIAFARAHIGLRQDVAAGRTQLDPAVGSRGLIRRVGTIGAGSVRAGGDVRFLQAVPRVTAPPGDRCWYARFRQVPAAERPAPGPVPARFITTGGGGARHGATAGGGVPGAAGGGGAAASRRAGHTSAAGCRAVRLRVRALPPGPDAGGRGLRSTSPDARPADDPAPAEPSGHHALLPRQVVPHGIAGTDHEQHRQDGETDRRALLDIGKSAGRATGREIGTGPEVIRGHHLLGIETDMRCIGAQEGGDVGSAWQLVEIDPLDRFEVSATDLQALLDIRDRERACFTLISQQAANSMAGDASRSMLRQSTWSGMSPSIAPLKSRSTRGPLAGQKQFES